ncbi:MAG TPA: DinB family protein [Fimbriimonas sp.]|nr:DinB family protein [Fimbriimonas sp.]
MLFDARPLEGYPEPYDLLCAILQDGTNEWRWEIDPELGEDAVVWQPYPGAQSIGAIMLHIINVEIIWFERVALEIPPDPNERKLLMADETDVDEAVWPVPHHKPISWYFDLHDQIRARTLERIKEWGHPASTQDLHGDARSMRWILGHVIQHEAYHGGQIVLLHQLWKRSQG